MFEVVCAIRRNMRANLYQTM